VRVSDESILYEAREGVATITLNRPAVLNAFTPEMLAALREALERAVGEGQRAVLLTGAGRGFSAGMDLASIEPQYRDGVGPDFAALLRDSFHPVVQALRTMELPVVAAVNGAAAGAGFSLALACDLRIAADSARFTTAFTRIGLVPDSGIAWILPRLTGQGRAAALMLLSEAVDAQGALAAGFVDRVVPADQLAAEAFALAQSLAKGPTRAYGLTKRLLNAAGTSSFEDLLKLEADCQAEAGATADHRGAVQAFLRKEPASFSGR
jgi:2-(1,2-epoxy-1,2-dihydrophenyl)acetyl-CoA isomerase